MDAVIFEAMQEVFLPYLGGAGQPALRLWIMLGVGVVFGTAILAWVGSLLSGGSVGRLMSLISVLICGALLVLGVALAHLYLVPLVPGAYAPYVLIGAGVVLFLALLVPLAGKMNGMNYLVSLGAAVAAVIAVILMMYLAGLVYDLITQGSSNMRTRRSSKQSTERFINR
jgi:hypothetical protein